jgi:hypothetical protein
MTELNDAKEAEAVVRTSLSRVREMKAQAEEAVEFTVKESVRILYGLKKYNVERIPAVIGISKNRVYELIAELDLPRRYPGRHRRDEASVNGGDPAHRTSSAS